MTFPNLLVVAHSWPFGFSTAIYPTFEETAKDKGEGGGKTILTNKEKNRKRKKLYREKE
jgi:hypothetical protein